VLCHKLCQLLPLKHSVLMGSSILFASFFVLSDDVIHLVQKTWSSVFNGIELRSQVSAVS
jgi:hypothetical protein